MELINECSLRFAEDKDFKLLVCLSNPASPSCAYMWKIIDSIMALFRVDFSGRGELSERQQKVSIYDTLCHVGIQFEDASSLHRFRRFISLRPSIVNQYLQMLSKLTKLSEEYNVLSFHLKVECSPRTNSCFLDISVINEPSTMSVFFVYCFFRWLTALIPSRSRSNHDICRGRSVKTHRRSYPLARLCH